MCVAVPMKVVGISEFSCVAEIDGVRKSVSLMALDDVKIGDYIMAHAGLAIARMDGAEAEKTLSLMREILEKTDDEIS